jgi:hypothetical protein
VGAFVMTCGALVAILAGLCSVAALSGNPTDVGAMVMVTLIGGVPVAAGVVTFGFGLVIYRGGRRPPRREPPQPPSGSSG